MFARVGTVSPGEYFDLYLRPSLAENSQPFGGSAGKIDDGSLAAILSIGSPVHDHDVHRAPVHEIRHAGNCTERITAVCGNRPAVIEFAAARGPVALKAARVKGGVSNLSVENCFLSISRADLVIARRKSYPNEHQTHATDVEPDPVSQCRHHRETS